MVTGKAGEESFEAFEELFAVKGYADFEGFMRVAVAFADLVNEFLWGVDSRFYVDRHSGFREESISFECLTGKVVCDDEDVCV